MTLKVNFFERIYDELDVGATGTVLMALNDGTLVYRRPFSDKLIVTNIAQGPVSQAVFKSGNGSSILVSRIDRIERLYSYRHVEGFPFIVAVGRTKNELLANWRRSSMLIAGAALLISAMFALLAKKQIRQIIIRVATVTAGEETQLMPADLIARADARLYEAKRGGRNTVCA